MINQFIQFIDSMMPLTEEDKRLLESTVKIKHYTKGEMLLSQGQVSSAFYFNLRGFVRLFYIKNGEEKTAWFYPEGYFVSAYESYVKQTASELNLQAMDDTSVVEITMETAFALLKHDPKFEALARLVMEDELVTHQKMIQSLLTLTPEERYTQLLDSNPTLLQQVPQHQIASYIGIQPESLSRIKKRYAEKSRS